ncbi:MAG TPA: protease modulator HflK, partial [Rhodocyclaceae bacterium]|nr:protease modulator HflK [Rhodocyclaceae bacterium]
ANAEGEASRFNQVYEEFSRAPVVTRERLYLETMQEVLSNTSKVMIDADSGSNLLLMPLDRLLQGGAAAPAAESKTQPTSTPGPTRSTEPLFDPRDRDMMRNRELGGR